MQIEQRTIDPDLFHPWEGSYDVPFNPRAEDFIEAKGLDKAYSDFYAPPFDIERLYWALGGTRPRGFKDKKNKKSLEASRTPLKVYVETSYPVKEPWGAWVTIKPESFGHIFRLLVEVTKHAYDLDAEEWYRKGRKTPPSVREVLPESKVVNRMPSELIGGSDFEGLYVEGFDFALSKDWPMRERAQRGRGGFLGLKKKKKKNSTTPHPVDPEMADAVLGSARLRYGW